MKQHFSHCDSSKTIAIRGLIWKDKIILIRLLNLSFALIGRIDAVVKQNKLFHMIKTIFIIYNANDMFVC